MRVTRPVVLVAGFQLGKRHVVAGKEADCGQGSDDLGGLRQLLEGGHRPALGLVVAFLFKQPLDLEGPRRRKVRIDGKKLGERVHLPAFFPHGNALTFLDPGHQQERLRMPGVVP